jgi:Ca-activated chloride channel family protein
MTFAWPLALCGLGVVALALVGYLIAQRRRRRYVVRFTNFDLLENVVSATPRWRRHIPAVLGLLALTALVVGLARPQMAVAVAREEATVVLAMDSSGSMTATDVAPDRMTAAREAASSFVDDLPDGFRVGLVSFSDQADVVVPPTADRQEAVDALGALVADNGTALGDAIARSVDLGVTSLDQTIAATRENDTPLAVVVLSDGANTTGDYTPLEAAQKAADAGVPVFTVAFGTDEGTVQGPDGFGGTRTIRVPPDPTTLRDVAEATGGQFFEAADEAALRSVYDEIGSQVGVDHEQKELTVAFTAAGALLLLLGGALSTLWFGRIP